MANARATPAGATMAVVVLTAMNLLNYVDRYVPSATKDLFKVDLHLDDAQTSLPLTAFIVVYMLSSPVVGTLADRWPRRVLIAAGVALWSLATAAAAFATGFWTFLGARALVGVGEAAYGTLAPTLLSDFYPPDRRNRILTLYYVAIPVGAALGFTVGGAVGGHLGWRAAFLVCGLPGLLAAAAILWVKDPGRGTFDTGPTGGSDWPTALRELSRNRSYVVTLAGYTAVTFASGAMADWFPTFLERYRGMSIAEAGGLVGTVTVAGGLGGTICGGLLADRLRNVTRQPYLATSAVSMVGAAVFATLATQAEEKTAITVSIFGAQFLMWFYNGPVNTILANSTSAALRPRAFALSILCIHLLGDAVSPPIVGVISDATGSLPLGIALVPVFLGVGAAIWAVGWRVLPELESTDAAVGVAH